MQEDEKDNNDVRQPSGQEEAMNIQTNILQINQQSDRSGAWQPPVNEAVQEEDEIRVA